MNPRYRILNIDGERYILDMGKSFWKILFPFFYWILPNTVYKVNDHEIIEKIRAPEVKQTSIGWQSVLGGVLALLLGNLLQPLVNYFNFESTPLVNSIIVASALLLVLSVFFYINVRSKKSLSQIVNFNQYSTRQLWIRPQSYKHFFFILLFYLLLLAFIILSWGGFIQIANAVILFAGMVFMFMALLVSILTVGVGDTTVKFKNDKKAVV